jgi:hypothetical protein
MYDDIVSQNDPISDHGPGTYIYTVTEPASLPEDG